MANYPNQMSYWMDRIKTKHPDIIKEMPERTFKILSSVLIEPMQVGQQEPAEQVLVSKDTEKIALIVSMQNDSLGLIFTDTKRQGKFIIFEMSKLVVD